ncbi:MAG: hypothetical protein PX481_05065 [Microcystis sp. M53603_WE2]|nr:MULTISPECIES: hypothetical protein [unclassified Microcystis]MDJ0538067.1 hypothetical protein [Microcystis sp. M53603_WE2]MDJ0606919.1 hypothetical protein [Microcystis sp. M53602_WE12]
MLGCWGGHCVRVAGGDGVLVEIPPLPHFPHFPTSPISPLPYLPISLFR